MFKAVILSLNRSNKSNLMILINYFIGPIIFTQKEILQMNKILLKLYQNGLIYKPDSIKRLPVPRNILIRSLKLFISFERYCTET
jgi:hypothetical protein